MNPRLEFPPLIAAALAGDRAALDNLTVFSYRSGFKTLRAMFPNAEHDILWDAVVDTATRVFDKSLLETWDESRGTWLGYYTHVLRNCALNKIRANNRRRLVERQMPRFIDEETGEETDLSDTVEDEKAFTPARHFEAKRALEAARHLLTPIEQRVADMLCDGRSTAEIAEVLQTSEGNVRTVVSRMRRRIREVNDGA